MFITRRLALKWCTAICVLSLLFVPVEALYGESANDVDILERTARTFSSVAKKAIPAVVFIHVEKSVRVGGSGSPHFNDPFGFFGDDFMRRFFGYEHPRWSHPRQFKQTGQGSGFIITEDGYILANNHVVGDVDKIMVRLHDGREFEAEVVGTDPHSEVAVIKIDAEGLATIPLGDSEALEIGEWVIAVGNPFGLTETLTVGVVSAKGRSGIGIADYENFIQTDAAINPGNSGGPLLNIKGEAVGINTAIFSRSGGYMGIGFAIPINMARDIKDQLIETGKVERGYIGIVIQDMNPQLARSFDLEEAEGILIARVQPGSAGDRAGLEPGDIILRLNGEKVENVTTFRNQVASFRPGTELTLDLLRNGREREIEVKIGSLDEVTQVASADGSELTEQLGIAVENLTRDMAQQFGYELDSGVLVTRVESGSPGATAGIEPGQLITTVNREPVTDVQEFESALEKSRETGTVLFLVTDGRFSRFVALSLE